MAHVSTENIPVGGLNATYNTASAGGDTFDPGQDVLLHVKNGSGASITATIVTPGTVQGQAIGDVTVTVPAGEERFAAGFPRADFANSNGVVDVTWSATTSVTFAVLRP